MKKKPRRKPHSEEVCALLITKDKGGEFIAFLGDANAVFTSRKQARAVQKSGVLDAFKPRLAHGTFTELPPRGKR